MVHTGTYVQYVPVRYSSSYLCVQRAHHSHITYCIQYIRYNEWSNDEHRKALSSSVINRIRQLCLCNAGTGRGARVIQVRTVECMYTL